MKAADWTHMRVLVALLLLCRASALCGRSAHGLPDDRISRSARWCGARGPRNRRRAQRGGRAGALERRSCCARDCQCGDRCQRAANAAVALLVRAAEQHGAWRRVAVCGRRDFSRGRSARWDSARPDRLAVISQPFARASAASEPRDRPAFAPKALRRVRRSLGGGGSEPAQRRARARVGESEGRSPSDKAN